MRTHYSYQQVHSIHHSKESKTMKYAIAMIAGAIAIHMPATAAAAVGQASDVEVLTSSEGQEAAAAGNFPAGYCTTYADLQIRNTWGGTYAKSGTLWQGNAKDWLKNAAKAGMTTSQTPTKYAIAVYGAVKSNGSLGHVAFVTAVDKTKGTYTVSEMNWTGLGKVSTRTLKNGEKGVIGFIPKPGK